MTVTYSLDVASSSFFCLHKLLFRWKGSIWQCVWSELAVWCFFYALLSVVYRHALTPIQRNTFEDISIFFDTYSGFIPITFMLGFYVSAVFGRWEKIFENIGWIDAPALTLAQHIQGSSERARIMRRNTLRYMVLCQALVFRDVSAGVRKRFPTMNHLVTAGLMTERELEHFDDIISPHAKYWQPMHWCFSNLRMARQEGLIHSDIIYTDIMEKVRIFRANVLNLTLFDWVPVPLVYTQVVHLAVRSFFVIALIGRQYLQPTRDLSELGIKKTVDIYVPIMSILQFVFFVGWMKVAEVLLNPLGEDDDDFECNYILDRNLQVGLSMVDDAFNRCPALERDVFWEDNNPEPLYTAESAARPCNPQVGSCANLEGTEDDQYMLRCRRRTISKSSNWDDVDENDIVKVEGLDKRKKDESQYGSGESLAFSQSFMNQSRKLSEMFRRMKGGTRRNSIASFNQSHRRKMSRQNSVMDPPPSDAVSRTDSLDSMEQFGESFHNRIASPTPAPNTQWQSKSDNTLKPEAALGMKKNGGSATGLAPPENPRETDRPPNSPSSVQWTVDEMLPVIEEEDSEKKRHSDGGSVSSASTKRGSMSTASTTREPSSEEMQTSNSARELAGGETQTQKERRERPRVHSEPAYLKEE